MTVYKLHKLLTELIKRGEARTKVCINKDSFHHVLEPDGCVILDVESADVEIVPLIDGDGGCATDSRGRERHFRALVINGGYLEPVNN